MILDSDPEISEFWFWTKKNIWKKKMVFVKEKKTEKENILRRKMFFVEEKMNEEIKGGKYLVKDENILRRKIFFVEEKEKEENIWVRITLFLWRRRKRGGI